MGPLIEDKCNFGSRRAYVMVLLTQTLGLSCSILQPDVAVTNGATGYIIGYFLAYVFFGIPILYMELIVSQFTERDCLEVWKARACLSHLGYVQILWQFMVLIFNHILVSFTVHYLLISFESPVPYHVCGNWAIQNDCMIISTNRSVNEDCLGAKEVMRYCENLYKTFTEYQYWRYYVLGGQNTSDLYIAWRVCLASGIVCIIVFINCFKRMQSVRWFLGIYVIYPFLGYLLMMIGSMTQKGLVLKYEEALDSNFSLFAEKFRISSIIQQVMYALNVGSGVMFNLSAGTSFRSPCYANTVITVVLSAAFCTLAVCTTAMMSCPYAFEYSVKTSFVMNSKMSMIFEKVPKLLYEYKYKTFWLVINYSCQVVLGISTDVVIFYSLTEMAAKRNSTIAKCPGLFSLFGTILLFLFSFPMFGPFGINIYVGAFKRFLYLTSTFIVTVECLVFIVWYGFDRFSEDVHFMQGIQPKNYMRIGWLLSSVVMAYVFFSELYYLLVTSSQPTDDVDRVGFYTIMIIVGIIIMVLIVRLLIAAGKKKFEELICLDPTWGPKSEVLQRSRAMFSAQAMTKEYLYRQYHLQAGILARQKKSNARIQREIFEIRTNS